MSNDCTRKTDRRLGKRLVKLADEDEWDKCLAILLERKQQQENSDAPLVWLGAKTEDGDALVHLAAYASCESGTSLKKRQLALQCLELILEADASAVQKMAADGGAALHAAIAAASACTMEASFDEDMSEEEYSNDSDSDDSEVEEEGLWESDSDSDCENKKFASISAESTKYADLISNQVTATAIDLLLQHGADPNKPMRNDIGDSDMEEMEFIYSRETIIEQWTPFTLCLIWAALASTKADLMTSEDSLILPLTVLRNMLVNGADPSTPMGADSPSNGVELIASCSHCFTTRIRCDLLRTNGIEVQCHDETIKMSDCIQYILQQHAKTEVPELTKEQSFAASLIANDAETASKLLSQEGDLDKWRSLPFSEVLPMPQATWCASGARGSWTILSACVALMATSSVKFLLTLSSSALSETDAIQAIEVAFTNEGMAKDVMMNLFQIECDGESRRQAQREMCAAIVHSVYPSSDAQSAEKRQMFLDRLLLRASGNQWGDLNAIEILLSLGADPDAESVAPMVQSSFRPLHFVAANSKGKSGVAMAKALVNAGANVNVRDAQGESPMNMALKHGNSLVAEYLWETAGQNSSLISAGSAFEFGVAAIACQSLPMIQQSVASIKASVNDLGSAQAEAMLGRLLLACVDERSGFKSGSESNGTSPLVEAVFIIIGSNRSSGSNDYIIDSQGSELLPTLERDDISKYTLLHSVLRNDRGRDVRVAVVKLLCDLAGKRKSRDSSDEAAVDWINLPCDPKFGSYTALHLACALGCEESIRTLLKFGADAKVQDYQGNQPYELLPQDSQLSPETTRQLGFD